ncbi:DUF6791 domain-containing protein [Niastella caeni]|uniref:DUF6791 domain-containing protein n=1 Tax=Niastella caeni TaxID=2569763 RepID=UPI0037423CA8
MLFTSKASIPAERTVRCNSTPQRLGIDTHHSFSNKPADGYNDYYDKVTRYVDIISAEAMAIDP